MKCPTVILLLFVFFGQCIVCSWQVQIARCPVVRINNGKVRPRARGRIARFSCSEGYTLVGNKYSTCVHGQWDTPIPVCVSTRCTLPQTPGHAFVASKLNGAILLYFCEPGYSLIGAAEIYCDGYQWNGTTPYCRDLNASAPTQCDFESPDLCWWEQDVLHDFDWKRHNFETPSLHIGTGPTHDHTLGAGNDGHYLYIEASGRLVNDTARIISPLYNSSLTESGCFSFWYHMYGATIGVLNVYFRLETDIPPIMQLMFSKAGNQGNQWYRGVFRLPKANTSFQIVIEGVRGSSYVSDIAIDDVAILQGDECVVKNGSTGVTVGDDDQIEIINAQQTCRDRCVYADVVLNATLLGPENCQCTLDCAERSTCCPDYGEYCILAYSVATVMPDGDDEGGAGVTGAREKNDGTAAGYTTNAPARNTAPTGFPINPKDDIDPGAPNSSPNTTRREPIAIATTAFGRATTKGPPRRTTTTTTAAFVGPTQRIGTRETPFAPVTLTTKYMELQDRSESRAASQNPERVKRSGGFEALEIVVTVGATLAAIALAIAIAIAVVRRRRTYKRGAGGSALSEDSDVRFLTSDEILDFNLARPTDNDEL